LACSHPPLGWEWRTEVLSHHSVPHTLSQGVVTVGVVVAHCHVWCRQAWARGYRCLGRSAPTRPPSLCQLGCLHLRGALPPPSRQELFSSLHTTGVVGIRVGEAALPCCRLVRSPAQRQLQAQGCSGHHPQATGQGTLPITSDATALHQTRLRRKSFKAWHAISSVL
jgi:hypothetical protein